MVTVTDIVYGCSCVRPNTTEIEMSKADAVLIGEVLGKSQDETYQIYEVALKVKKSYKGHFDEEIIIRTGMDSASCGFAFEENKTYLIYAYQHERESGGYFSTGICSRTKLLAEATEDLEVLNR